MDEKELRQDNARLKAKLNRMLRLSNLGRWISAWFWFPIHTATWKLWRSSIASREVRNARLRELVMDLRDGNETERKVARDLWNILTSKY